MSEPKTNPGRRLIHTPIDEESIHDLRIGDIVYLSGVLVTGRDEVHSRIVSAGMPPPLDFRGMAMYHADPIIRESPGLYELISVGPTSSIRMEEWAADFIEKTGIKMMIGKGGMGKKTADACRRLKAIHCVYPGGCAVLGASQVEAVENLFWRELGMPECVWVMRVREAGPLIVSIDSQGNNLFGENAAFFASRREACMKPIFAHLRCK
jgi:L(+)-tartrate dehydratase beta subunit